MLLYYRIMFFCPNCNNVFNITRGTTQLGGELERQKDMFPDITTTESTTDSTTESTTGNMTPTSQEGGDDINDIINKILDNEEITTDTIGNIPFDDIIKSITYKKLKGKDKEIVFNKIQDILPVEQKQVIQENQEKKQQFEYSYFRCTNCGFLKKIEPRTLIFSKVSSDIAQNYVTSDVSIMKHSDILPRTRKYICPKKDCESHTNPEKREAVFFRMNNTFRVKYICTTCDTNF